MSNKKYDICLKCPNYAMGCEPLVMPDGSRLRQLQRDITKRFCHHHMPGLNAQRVEAAMRTKAGLPKPEVPAAKLPWAPREDEYEINEGAHYFTPTIFKPETTALYVVESVKRMPTLSKILDVRWELKQPCQSFFREGELFHVAVLIGRRECDNVRVRAVKYRASRKSQVQWWWPEDGTDEVVMRKARRLPHENGLVWQWGLIASMLSHKPPLEGAA
jgi:hypothetical protein